jgi:hypothetical protein
MKVALQTLLLEEKERAQGSFAFPTDNPGFQISDLSKITATILEPFIPQRHCDLSDLTSVYFCQPWLAIEAVKDVRLEEEIMTLSLELFKVFQKIII